MPVQQVTYRGVTHVLIRLNGQAATVRFETNPDFLPGELRVTQTHSQVAPMLTHEIVAGTEPNAQVLMLTGTDPGFGGPHQSSSTEVTPENANWRTYEGPLQVSPLRNSSTRTEVVITVSRDGCQYAIA